MAFSMACASNCGEVTLTPNPSSCVIKERFTTPSRLILIPCDATLPTPIKGAIKPLFDSGQIVYTSELGNWEFGDPSYANSNVSSCRPVNKIITSRTIGFQDRISLSVTSGSPATTNDYADYDFWRDKLEKQGLWYAALWHCNGDTFLPRTASGLLIRATLTGFVNYEVLDQESNLTVEFKKFSLTYQGDPFAFNAPDFNTFTEGITL